ncbi:MAG: vWA domain-containing protein [Phaeospirillum sp.]|nr:vWA domain-containing protein [Phaeospirillum sp.]
MAGLLPASPAAAAEPAPLLMEGKKSLYQRVLTRPGAILVAQPGATEGKAQAPFTIFYVFERKVVDGASWLRVATASRGNGDGWIRADASIDWKQSIVVAFANPAGRNRLVLYKDRKFLTDLMESPEAIKKSDAVMAQAVLPNRPADFPAMAVEPANYIDFTKNFYLLPILDADEIYLASGFTSRLLKVASVTAEETAGPAAKPPPATKTTAAAVQKTADNALAKFDTGVVFVVDATTSMDPYIERTRSAVAKISGAIRTAGLTNRVAFGLTGFRDDPKAVPGIEYLTRTFIDLHEGRDLDKFAAKAANLTATKVSSRRFSEDCFAGLIEAINKMDWSGFGGRYIILITDAGPRPGKDPFAATGLDTAGLRQLAADKGIAIYVVHLLTPAGKNDHEYAAGQYKELAAIPQGNLYYGVQAGDINKFGQAIETLSAQLVEQVNQVSKGKSPTRKAEPGDLGRLQENSERVATAMKLAYLGRAEGTKAPPVFEAWMADRDPGNASVPALEVRILLTKNQLSDLQDSLKAIIAAGEKGQVSPQTFFDQIKSAAATLSRTPEQVAKGNARSLAATGLLGEYLDGLPYKSKVMNVTQDMWLSWSVGEQQSFLDGLEAKVKLYQQFHDDVDRWVVLDGGRVKGDAVYPVPLDALP